MLPPAVKADSLITLDIGTTATRAHLFDVVNERYRFIASGIAPTTIGPPINDVREGILNALAQLQDTTQRTLLGNNGGIIIPSQPDGTGVDALAATLSAGPEIKVVALGLLENVSLESAVNLAKTTYTSISETISINDRRKQDQRIDTILRVRPNLIIMAGGIDGGAERTPKKLLEAVSLACYLMPGDTHPQVLYAGNKDIHKDVKEALENLVELDIAPNIHPSLNTEHIMSAHPQISKIYTQIRSQQLYGLSDVKSWTDDHLEPGATAFARIIHFLGQVNSTDKGVLGIDIGASALTLAAANTDDLFLRVYTELGFDAPTEHLLANLTIEKIARWLPIDISHAKIRDYLYNKAPHPGSRPSTTEEMFIEQALIRQHMRSALKSALPKFHPQAANNPQMLMPAFEPIMIAGQALTNAPSLGQTLLMALDGIQPTGITTMVLDQNNIAASLGVASTFSPLISVQILESNAFINLGTIISPVGYAHPGNSILRVTTKFSNGAETHNDIEYGTISLITVPQGQSATLQLRPLHRFDVGMGGPGRGGKVQVVGGALGVVIDARGRPLELPSDGNRRRKAIRRWLRVLDG
ncbi:MAG: glutamate mutase L [Chloroflexota bacterium]